MGDRARSPAVLSLVVLVSVMVGGCTSPSASPSSSPSASAPASELLPVYPAEATEDAIRLETASTAQALADAIGEDAVLNDDLVDQVTPASETTGAYYGIIQTLTLDPALDAADRARTLVLQLGEAGWRVQESTDTDSEYLVALLSDDAPGTSWFLIVGADLAVPDESVVTLQLASPDLP